MRRNRVVQFIAHFSFLSSHVSLCVYVFVHPRYFVHIICRFIICPRYIWRETWVVVSHNTNCLSHSVYLFFRRWVCGLELRGGNFVWWGESVSLHFAFALHVCALEHWATLGFILGLPLARITLTACLCVCMCVLSRLVLCSLVMFACVSHL